MSKPTLGKRIMRYIKHKDGNIHNNEMGNLKIEDSQVTFNWIDEYNTRLKKWLRHNANCSYRRFVQASQRIRSELDREASKYDH